MAATNTNPLLRYAFSIFNPRAEWNSSTTFEYNLSLMTTIEENVKYIFKFSGVLDPLNTFFQDCSNFEHCNELLDLFMLYRHWFTIKAIINTENPRVPIMLRFYTKADLIAQSFSSCNLSSITALNNEQALFSFLNVCKHDIVIEPMAWFPNPLIINGGLCIPPKKPRCPLKITIPHLRCLTSEQRHQAQHLLDTIISKNADRRFIIPKELVVSSNGVSINLSSGILEKSRPVGFGAAWEDIHPSGSFVKFTRGCGKKRTFVAFMEMFCKWKSQVSKTDLENYHKSKLLIEANVGTRFYAPELCIVVCSEDSIEKWKNEMIYEVGLGIPRIFIKEIEDFDEITYEVVKSGVMVFITVEMVMCALKQEEDVEIELVKTLFEKDGSGKMNDIDKQRCIRFHANNLSSRLPQSKAPLSFLKSGCLILDDLFNYFDYDTAQLSTFFSMVASFLQTDWTFLSIGYDGFVSKTFDSSWIKAASPVLNVPINASKEYFAHIWRLFHEDNATLSYEFTYPKSFLRKLTIVSHICTLSDNEKSFFANFPKMQDMYKQEILKHSILSEILLGKNCLELGGMSLETLLGRLKTITIEEAKEHVNMQYYRSEGGGGEIVKGTLSQRVKHFVGAPQSWISHSEFSDKQFVDKSLNDMETSKCIVCMEENASELALCGHLFCLECASMTKSGITQRAAAPPLVIPCPVCRIELCEYDWLHFSKDANNASSSTENKLSSLSKILRIQESLESIFYKRRFKKRNSPMHAILLVPSSTIYSIGKWFAKQYIIKYAANFEEESVESNHLPLKHTLYIFGFDQVMSACSLISNSLEALLLACPTKTPELYYELIRSCCINRSSPLQVHMFHAPTYENTQEIEKIFF